MCKGSIAIGVRQAFDTRAFSVFQWVMQLFCTSWRLRSGMWPACSKPAFARVNGPISDYFKAYSKKIYLLFKLTSVISNNFELRFYLIFFSFPIWGHWSRKWRHEARLLDSRRFSYLNTPQRYSEHIIWKVGLW